MGLCVQWFQDQFSLSLGIWDQKDFSIKIYCRWHDILCQKYKILTKNLELISSCYSIAGYVVNIKNQLFFDTSNEEIEFKIENTVPFILVPPPKWNLKYKSNKLCIRSIWEKVQDWYKRKKKYKRDQSGTK